MRAAGCDHGELNRFSMCRRTCDPNPSTTRPPEYSCSWLVVYAMLIGLRAKATAIPVPSDTDVECSAASVKRQERVVRRLGRPDAVEPGRLGGAHPVGHPGQLRTRARCRSSPWSPRHAVADAVAAFLIRRRTGAGVGAGPLTAGASTDSDSGSPTCTKRPAAGCR